MKMYLTDKYCNPDHLRLGHSYEVVPLKYKHYFEGYTAYSHCIEVSKSVVVFLTDKEVAKSFYKPKEEN